MKNMGKNTTCQMLERERPASILAIIRTQEYGRIPLVDESAIDLIMKEYGWWGYFECDMCQELEYGHSKKWNGICKKCLSLN